MTPGSHGPLVTVAIPLCRSRTHLSNVIDNIERLAYPHLDIVISDRH